MALVPLLAATDSGVKLEGPCDGEESADSGANTVNGVGWLPAEGIYGGWPEAGALLAASAEAPASNKPSD